jgi:hypothetical protein
MGDVLILSVNRVPYSDQELYIRKEPQRLAKTVQSASDCEDQCRVVSGCQGWTYCSRPEGCGTGCLEYHNKTEPRESLTTVWENLRALYIPICAPTNNGASHMQTSQTWTFAALIFGGGNMK